VKSESTIWLVTNHGSRFTDHVSRVTFHASRFKNAYLRSSDFGGHNLFK